MTLGLLLDKRVDVWRFTNQLGGMPGQADTRVYAGIPCAIVPVSSFDQDQSYSYESTHVVFVPNWLILRKEDEVRYGRRPPDNFGNVVPFTFVINGRKTHTLAGRNIAYYARERD